MLGTLFSFQGRIGLKDFWMYYIGVSLVALVLRWLIRMIFRGAFPMDASAGVQQSALLIANVLMLTILIAASVSLISLGVRRCRDAGINPWLLLIPIVNVLVLLACMFAPTGWRSGGKAGPAN